MKLLLSLAFTLFSLNLMAMDKESAREMYELNKNTFHSKELLNDPNLCEFQNELATILGEELLPCSKRRSSRDDTSKGDKLVTNTINEANKMEVYQKQFDELSKEEFDMVIDDALKRMKKRLN